MAPGEPLKIESEWVTSGKYRIRIRWVEGFAGQPSTEKYLLIEMDGTHDDDEVQATLDTRAFYVQLYDSNDVLARTVSSSLVTPMPYTEKDFERFCVHGPYRRVEKVFFRLHNGNLRMFEPVNEIEHENIWREWEIPGKTGRVRVRYSPMPRDLFPGIQIERYAEQGVLSDFVEVSFSDRS